MRDLRSIAASTWFGNFGSTSTVDGMMLPLVVRRSSSGVLILTPIVLADTSKPGLEQVLMCIQNIFIHSR